VLTWLAAKPHAPASFGQLRALKRHVAAPKWQRSQKMHQDLASRERTASVLPIQQASCQFKLTRQGDRYSLCRTVGLSGENLTLDEVEEELEQLRSYHAG